MEESTKIKNKEMLLYSAEKAVNEVSKLKNEDVSDEEAYFRIGTAIHWLIDCIDRLTDNGVVFESKVEKAISGLRFVNNSLKHKSSFKKADIDERYSFPNQFKIKYGLKYDFASLDDIEHDEKDGRFKNYKNELEGRDIVSFLPELLDITKNYYKDF